MSPVHNSEKLTEADVNFLLYYYLEPTPDDSDVTLAAKRLIKGLPDKEKVSLVLSLDGQTYRSIGEYMGKPFTSVSRWVNNAKRKLVEQCHSYRYEY